MCFAHGRECPPVSNSSVVVDCSGVKDLLSAMGNDVKDKAIRAALRAGAKIEQAAVQASCPERIDLPSGTALPVGALAADVIIKQGGRNAETPYVVVTFGKYSKHVARWVEDGHKVIQGRGSERKDTGKVTTPNPFVSEAFESSEQAVESAIRETFIETVTKAAK